MKLIQNNFEQLLLRGQSSIEKEVPPPIVIKFLPNLRTKGKDTLLAKLEIKEKVSIK